MFSICKKFGFYWNTTFISNYNYVNLMNKAVKPACISKNREATCDSDISMMKNMNT